MRVLKVVGEGITTSFRYPHFMQQIHPTYPMPPPATIYGHIASALGEWFEPRGVQFAYQFTYTAEVKDIEHTIVLSSSRGVLKSTRIPKVLEGRVNPFDRFLLFQPHLTLYINHPEWRDAFLSPRYAVVLGRSQDLFTYTSVEVVELLQAESAYFEHTLLPYNTNHHTTRGYAITMPRYLDYGHRRHPIFAQYFMVQERVQSADFMWFNDKKEERYWIDPESQQFRGAHLGLAFHSFVEDENVS